MENTNDKPPEIEGIKAAPAAGAAPSIDTPQFRDLLSRVWHMPTMGGRDERAKPLVGHIDQHVAAAVAEAEKRGFDMGTENGIAVGRRAAEIDRAATAPVSEADKFCDANCTWRDHAAGCVRAVSEAGQAQDVCAEMRALCSACGGTGDVTSITGEWRGSCECATLPAAMDEAAERARFEYRAKQEGYNTTPDDGDGYADTDTHKAWIMWRAALAAPAATAPQAGELPALSLEEIRGAVARGWCHPTNAAKEMDVDLAAACADEVAALLALRQPQGEKSLRRRENDLWNVFVAMQGGLSANGFQGAVDAGLALAAKQAGKEA